MSEPITSPDAAAPTVGTPVAAIPVVSTPVATASEIPESDKPFILALVSAGITVLCIVLGIVASWFSGNAAVADWATKAFEGTLPLTVMAWSWYFHSKSGG
jgi:hypothetical protein